jgi:predicted lysophospholipase L1 biosynthesis ABC-type transport system permease subunit
MGYTEANARKSAWQFLQKTTDPRVSMLARFAEALNISIVDLVR